jgi:hypothetical protein
MEGLPTMTTKLEMKRVEHVWASTLERACDFLPGRLVISFIPDVMPEKTLMRIEGGPPLTKEEDELVVETIKLLNAALGGRPILEPAKA